MSPKKRTLSAGSQVRPTPDPKDPKDALMVLAPTTRLARIPSPARFLLVALGSLVVSSVLFTLTASLTRGDLGLVSKHLEEWWEVGGLIAWRGVEVGLAWVLGFDSWDVASYLFLTHLPTYSLLWFFYKVRPTSVLASYAITILSTVIPFAFLRRSASVHDLSHTPSDAIVNRGILQDRLTTIYTSLAATSIYSVILYASYASWLPAQLVVHFESIPDISAAHAGPAGLPALFLSLVPAGYAVRDFLFVSSTGRSTAKEAKQPASREGEYLIVAIYRKTWCQLSMKTRILVSRTLILATAVLLNTTVQVAGTIQSVSVEGASTWGAIWAVATLATGATFGWIEAVDGV
ncbi:hypothetical protein N7462_002217 [Penicillium macrosclerotiorum]|uniref:uncharacterized protein n=1 Tax=Penicillium macrosclerotiorum TaxID=303699 RepID=UPI0025473095|nr:uncharacterized protein N7462_002217 [Penicillium macrosclerotiorum]KAJ5692794.1 hypothetical protein N7462_002217 [Penicillium macrosclerotiorum]